MPSNIPKKTKMMRNLQGGKYNVCKPNILNKLRANFGYSPTAMTPEKVLSNFMRTLPSRERQIFPLCSQQKKSKREEIKKAFHKLKASIKIEGSAAKQTEKQFKEKGGRKNKKTVSNKSKTLKGPQRKTGKVKMV